MEIILCVFVWLDIEKMEAHASFKGAISNILRYNLQPNTLLCSNSDGKIQTLDLHNNCLVYLADLRNISKYK